MTISAVPVSVVKLICTSPAAAVAVVGGAAVGTSVGAVGASAVGAVVGASVV
jgi:hypothetical protein